MILFLVLVALECMNLGKGDVSSSYRMGCTSPMMDEAELLKERKRQWWLGGHSKPTRLLFFQRCVTEFQSRSARVLPLVFCSAHAQWLSFGRVLTKRHLFVVKAAVTSRKRLGRDWDGARDRKSHGGRIRSTKAPKWCDDGN